MQRQVAALARRERGQERDAVCVALAGERQLARIAAVPGGLRELLFLAVGEEAADKILVAVAGAPPRLARRGHHKPSERSRLGRIDLGVCAQPLPGGLAGVLDHRRAGGHPGADQALHRCGVAPEQQRDPPCALVGHRPPPDAASSRSRITSPTGGPRYSGWRE